MLSMSSVSVTSLQTREGETYDQQLEFFVQSSFTADVLLVKAKFAEVMETRSRHGSVLAGTDGRRSHVNVMVVRARRGSARLACTAQKSSTDKDYFRPQRHRTHHGCSRRRRRRRRQGFYSYLRP